MPRNMVSKISPIPVKNANAIIFLPSFFAGIGAGFSLYAIVIILVFLIFLSLYCTTKKTLRIIGFNFFMSVWLTKFILATDIFYGTFGNPQLQVFYDFIYLILGVFFVAVAIASFLDWLNLKSKKQGPQALVKYPAFFDHSDRSELAQTKDFYKGCSTKRGAIFLYFISFWAGVLVTILESSGPQNYMFYVENYFLIGQGDHPLAMIRFFLYALFFSFPLMVIIVLVERALAHKNARGLILKHKALYKIIVSAVFLSVGISLVYVARI